MLEVRQLPVDGGTIHVLRLHRPPVNAMNTAMLEQLLTAMDDVDADTDAAGLVLHGGDGPFSAGADLKERTEDHGVHRMEVFTQFYRRLTTFPLPTAAAVEGPAVGGGAEAIAACDLRVLTPDATLRFPGASMGIPVGTARLVDQVGLGVAKDWLLTGRTVTADEAERRGLAQRLVEPGAALDTALDWVRQSATHDRATVRRLKALAHAASGLGPRLEVENDALRAASATGDTPYGRAADA